jgi:hypothetical protein
MTRLDFGQPLGGVRQTSYTVEDIEAAIGTWSRQLGVGPWFLRGPFTPATALYRRRPTEMSISLALSFSGRLQIELIQQHNDAASVYRETIAKRGYGFHHWGVGTEQFDAKAEDYAARGYEQVFSDVTPAGTRVAYFDTTRDLPGMVELIEINATQEQRYARMYAAALAWDGQDPIRRS